MIDKLVKCYYTGVIILGIIVGVATKNPELGVGLGAILCVLPVTLCLLFG